MGPYLLLALNLVVGWLLLLLIGAGEQGYSLSHNFKVVVTGGSGFPLGEEYLNLLYGDVAVP